MRVFLDTEFTSLDKNAELISIGLIAENGNSYYAELPVNEKKCSNFTKEHVLSQLLGEPNKKSKNKVKKDLIEWFRQFDKVTIYADVLAWDWVLFCDIFGGAFSIPSNIYYIPVDISTILLMSFIDPDINRSEYSGIESTQHNSLVDARMSMEVYKKAIKRLKI